MVRTVAPPGAVVVLLDADGTLFPSEEPAFEASAEVTNAMLASLGSERRFLPAELQEVALGRNFRSTAGELAGSVGANLAPEELEAWVAREQDAVTTHLGTVLRPDLAVLDAVCHLSMHGTLAVVSSSALERLAVSLEATGLDTLLPAPVRFSAVDSLPVPSSKPDPAVYLAALATLGVDADLAVAVEDAVAGVQAATAAGVRVVGCTAFVPPAERGWRAEALRDAGAHTVAESWDEVVATLLGEVVTA